MTEGESAAVFFVSVVLLDAATAFFVLGKPVAAAACATMLVTGLLCLYILTRQPA